MHFDLSESINFELRRGDIDSAPAEDLRHRIAVMRKLSDKLEMKIDFEKPEMVSIGSKPDVLVAEIKNESFFSNLDDPAAIEEGTQVKRVIPRQLLGDKFEEIAITIHDSLQETAGFLVVGNVFLTIFIALSLKSMWHLLNVMQIVSFMRYFTAWPAIVDKILE